MNKKNMKIFWCLAFLNPLQCADSGVALTRVRRVPSVDEAKKIGGEQVAALNQKLADETLKQIKNSKLLEKLRLGNVVYEARKNKKGTILRCAFFYVLATDKDGCLSTKGHDLKVTHKLTPQEFQIFNEGEYRNYFFDRWSNIVRYDAAGRIIGYPSMISMRPDGSLDA